MAFEAVGIDNLILVAALIAIVAFFYSNLGLGGGQLYVPIMDLIFPAAFVMEDIVPLSLSFAFVTMLTSTYTHSQKNLVDFKLGLYLAGGGLVGVVAGVLFTTNVADDIVKTSFATMLVIVATKMMYDIYSKKKDASSSPTEHGMHRLLAGFGVSVLTGVLIGSFGIGGGVVSVPLIIYVFRFEPRKAIGTSALVGALLTPAAFLGYVLDESVNGGVVIHYDLVWILAPLVFIFALLGSRWGLEKLRTRTVKTIFTCGVYLAAAGMLFSLLFT